VPKKTKKGLSATLPERLGRLNLRSQKTRQVKTTDSAKGKLPKAMGDFFLGSKKKKQQSEAAADEQPDEMERHPAADSDPITTQHVDVLAVHAERDDLEKLVIKDSNPLADRDNEGKMFMEVQGKFGIPEVLGYYTVEHHSDVDREIPPADATYFPVFRTPDDNADENPAPEHRRHVRTIIKTLGSPLFAAESPKALVRALLHAMLGMSQHPGLMCPA
jgi:hypothetical protein